MTNAMSDSLTDTESVGIIVQMGFPDSYSLDELAEHSGIEPRTIRSYVSKGLLPRPSRGRSARYEASSLDRLQAIKRLLDETGCSLEYCRSLLDGFEDEYIARIASGEEQIRVVDPVESRAITYHYDEDVLFAQAPEPHPDEGLRIEGADTWIQVRISEDVVIQMRADSEKLTQKAAERIVRSVRRIVDGK